MSGLQRQQLVITNLRGRDGSTTADIAIPPQRCREMVNVDLYRTPFARKRNGCENAFTDTTGEAFTGTMSALGRFIPGSDETAAQLWAVDDAATPVVQRLTGGTVWSTPTLKDNIATKPWDVCMVPFNGKLFLFYDSTQDRLHVWDGSTVRRVGLATPAAPTAADLAGSFATIRYYKVIYTDGTGAPARWSEASPSVSITPASGGARVTKPAAINEGETHWKIYVSADDILYFLLTTLAVGTTTYDDTSDPSSHSDADPIPVVGDNIVPTSAKFGVVHDNKLLMGGSWESGPSSRIKFTAPIGASDYQDDERVPDTVDFSFWLDVNEKDGDYLTGLGEPIQGMPIAFKNRHIYKLAPISDAQAPYVPILISKSVGAIRHQGIVLAEDENGDPALYFWSHRGPYRLGIHGLQFLGRDVEDIHLRLNIDATTVPVFAIWHEDKHQVWFYLAVDTANEPNIICKYDVHIGRIEDADETRGGWTLADGAIADARCGVMFADTFGSSMSRTLLPYLGSNDAAARLLRADTGAVDFGDPYAAYVKLQEKHLGGLHKRCTVDQVIVLGNAGPHTFQFDITRDYGCEQRSSNVTMSAETGDQTRSQKVFENAYQTDAKSVGMRIGDICPTAHQWQIDALLIQHEIDAEIAQ